MVGGSRGRTVNGTPLIRLSEWYYVVPPRKLRPQNGL